MPAIFEIVNEDYELAALPNSAGIGDPSKFIFNPSEDISTDILTNSDKGVLLDKLNWTVQPGGCTLPGYTLLNGKGTLEASSTKCKAENDSKKIFLKLDIGDCDGKFQLNSYPYTQIVCMCKIIVKDPGQNKVKGE